MTSLIVTKNDDIIDMARSRIQSRIDTSATPAQQEAQEAHYIFVEIAKLGKQAGLALRDVAANMWLTQGFRELRVPYPTDETLTMEFDDFESWISYAVEQAGLSDTTTSTLKNFIINVVDPVAKQLILNPTTGVPFQLSEVLGLREAHTQKLASAARRTLANGEMTADEKLKTIGDLLQIAADPTITQDDFILELRNRSLSNRRNEPFEAKIAHANGKTAILILVDESKEMIVNTALEGRSLVSQRTVDDLVGDLMAIQLIPSTDVSDIDTEEVSFPEVGDQKETSAEDFEQYLKDM